jgi:hypothetical protein
MRVLAVLVLLVATSEEIRAQAARATPFPEISLFPGLPLPPAPAREPPRGCPPLPHTALQWQRPAGIIPAPMDYARPPLGTLDHCPTDADLAQPAPTTRELIAEWRRFDEDQRAREIERAAEAQRAAEYAEQHPSEETIRGRAAQAAHDDCVRRNLDRPRNRRESCPGPFPW